MIRNLSAMWADFKNDSGKKMVLNQDIFSAWDEFLGREDIKEILVDEKSTNETKTVKSEREFTLNSCTIYKNGVKFKRFRSKKEASEAFEKLLKMIGGR